MKTAILFLTILGLVCSQPLITSFEAQVTINDPNIVGVLTGRFFYSLNPGRIRIDYSGLAGTFQEFFEYGVVISGVSTDSRYLVCNGNCQGETVRQRLVFVREANDAATGQSATIAGRTCSRFNKASVPAGGVQSIFVDGSGFPCQATLTTGKVFTFSNPVALTLSGNLGRPANCPVPTCTAKQDIMLVFDESGSIDSTSFGQLRSFGVSLGNSFTFGPQNIAMGLVQFDTDARLSIGIVQNKQVFLNAMGGIFQQGQATCIGCGIQAARNELFGPRARGGVAKIMLTLTDGQNNVNTVSFGGAINQAKGDGITMIAIGVSGFVLSEVQQIASASNLVFTSANFAALPTILAGLTAVTCNDLPGNPCGAGCRGFCACGATCICPVCQNPDGCTINQCVIGQAGNGCFNTPRVCNDNNACTRDTCNPAVTPSGCTFTNIANTCVDGNACTQDGQCDPATGCIFPAITCNDNDVCTVDGCNPSTGCTFNTVPSCLCQQNRTQCPQNTQNLCKIDQCDPNTGNCIQVDKNCNSSSRCITDSCDTRTGNCIRTPVICNDNNACTDDSCDPDIGCVFTPFNISTRCNDNSVCTIDSCNVTVGCVNTLIPSNNTDRCVSQVCNSVLGYTFDPLDCSTQFDPNQIGTCYVVSCDSSTGCALVQLPNTFVDQCGFCVNATGETNPFCFLGLDAGETAGLGAGIIAAIVIAVIVAVIIASLSGTAGYVAWKRHRRNMQGAQGNPLYNDGGRTGQNPFFQSPN